MEMEEEEEEEGEAEIQEQGLKGISRGVKAGEEGGEEDEGMARDEEGEPGSASSSELLL